MREMPICVSGWMLLVELLDDRGLPIFLITSLIIIQSEGEWKPAYASGFALGTRVNEKMISPSIPKDYQMANRGRAGRTPGV